MSVGLTYRNEAIDDCGNDITFWLRWLRRHAAVVDVGRPILIDGVWPEVLKVTLPFGNVGPLQAEAAGQG